MRTGRRLEIFWEVDWAYLSLFSTYVVLVREWRSSVVGLAVGYKSSAEELSQFCISKATPRWDGFRNASCRLAVLCTRYLWATGASPVGHTQSRSQGGYIRAGSERCADFLIFYKRITCFQMSLNALRNHSLLFITSPIPCIRSYQPNMY